MIRWQTFGYQKRLFGFAGFVEVEIVEIVVMDGLGQTVVRFVGRLALLGLLNRWGLLGLLGHLALLGLLNR